MAASVSEAFSILKGRKSGNPEAAQSFLGSLPPQEVTLRNRNESRLRAVRKKRNPMAKNV